MIVCLTGTPLANLFRGGFIYCNHEGSDVGHRSELCDQGVEAAAVSMGVYQHTKPKQPTQVGPS